MARSAGLLPLNSSVPPCNSATALTSFPSHAGVPQVVIIGVISIEVIGLAQRFRLNDKAASHCDPREHDDWFHAVLGVSLRGR